MQKYNLTLLATTLLTFGTCSAAVTLPRYITDNMIVQQNSTLTVKGHAAPGSEVSVKSGWDSKTGKTRVDADGNFTLRLSTPPAGGPYSIIFTDKDGATTVENVLSGEVWLCSGQSNMEFPVQGWTTVMDYDRVVATAHHPDIRLLQVRKTTAFSPCEDVEVNGGGWQICSSASMADFSAIAYFFACELAERLKVPVATATPEQPDDRTIILRSHAVDTPVSVKYNWADYPQGNLYGPTGLPVAPFSYDN